jgi:polar amino acid transport system substrate-binding protein
MSHKGLQRFWALVLCVALVLGLAAVGWAGPVLARIQQRGELRVGTEPNFPPLEARAKDGSIIGFDMDLARHIARAMGVKLKVVAMPLKELLPALERGELDMAISGLTITPKRNLKVVFVGPYLMAGQTALVRREVAAKVRSVADLNRSRYTVVASADTTAAEAVRRLLPKARLITVPGEDRAIKLLLAGKAQAMVADLPFCTVMAFRHRDQGLLHLDTPFTFEPLGIAIAQGDPDLANWLANFLTLLRGTGILDRMGERWFRDASWMKQLAP